MNTPTSLAKLLSGLGEPPVLLLGLSQTIGYGSLYYAIGVTAPVISSDYGVGVEVFFGAFTVGLLLGGLIAPWAGRLLDQYGARRVMMYGSVLAGFSLIACALAPGLWSFCAAIILVEIASCFVLYEAAFAALTQIYRYDARRYISAITLIAGFASTIFWPLTHWLVSGLGWRSTLMIFAVAHLAVCLPIHALTLGRARAGGKSEGTSSAPDAAQPLVHEASARTRALVLYTGAICISGIVYSSFPVHLLSIISGEGFSPETAALIAMLMGPAQVLARIVEISTGHRFDPLVTGRVALAALVAAIAIVLIPQGSWATACAFAILYGVSQGLISIVRGTVPLQLFGPRGYATLVGRITGLRFLVNAAAPFLFALAVSSAGMNMALAMNGLAALAAAVCFWLLERPGVPAPGKRSPELT